MKILHVISGDLWAGAEVQALALLTALQKSGEAEVAAALMNEGELARRLRACGIPVTVFDETRLNGLQIITQLRHLMRQWAPTVVHTHRVKENILGAIANRLGPQAACVRTVHGAPEHHPRGLRQLHNRLLTLINEWCGNHLQQRVIAVSTELAGKLTPIYHERTIVIKNGLDIAAVQAAVHPVEFLARTPGGFHIGIVGRLVPVKRMDLFIETASWLSQHHPQRDWYFHIIGDGPLLNDLLLKTAAAGVGHRVILHGHRSDSVACIAGLDALVMCSDHEGLPMTLLEAMCVGTIVVGHNVGGIEDLLNDGQHGWPVVEHTAAGYAQAIIAALAHTDDNDRRLQMAKQHVFSHYSAESCAQQHLLVYRQLATASNKTEKVSGR